MTSPANKPIGRNDRAEVVGDVEVGTYFMAFDLRRDDEPEGPPLLWETWVIRCRDIRRTTLSYVRHASEEAARQWHRHAVGYLLSQHRSGAALSDFQLKVNLRLELYLRGTHEASLPLPGSSPGGRSQWYPNYAGPDGRLLDPPADDGEPVVDETTLPVPVDDEPVGEDTSIQAWATGDFRTRETTIAVHGDVGLLEVRLLSENGYCAHFALDSKLAAGVGRELEREISAFGRHHPLPAFPFQLTVTTLEDPGTDVFFCAGWDPVIRVSSKPDDDRISLRVHDETAYLHITMQVCVALALRDCLLAASSACTVTMRGAP